MQHKKQEYIDMIVDYIDEYRDSNGGSTPTGADIAAGVGLAPSTVSKYMSFMREQGIIDYSGHRNIFTKQSRQDAFGFCRVPILGAVACGVPKYAEENIEEYVRLPVALFGRGSFYLLRANGDSMIEAGIDDGDLVLIRQQSTAEEGQIVVALMEDEATLKRFYPEPENGIIRLHPENRTMEDIIVENCIIQGVAMKVLKDLE